MGLSGIGLAASAAAGVNLALLLWILRRREGRLRGREILVSFARVAVASAVMGVALAAASRWLALDNARGWIGAIQVVCVILGGAAIYWVAASLAGAPEPSELRAVALKRRA